MYQFRSPAPPRSNRPPSGFYTLAPPTRGWIANEPLFLSAPGGALVLENFTPTQTGIRPRGGSRTYATIPAAVRSGFPYVVAGLQKLFVSDQNNIYDVSTIADPNTPPAPAVTGRSSGYYSTVQMTNAVGTSYLFAANGTDDILRYNGTIWLSAANTPAITGASGLSAVWKYRGRVFFINNTLTAYYLDINSVGGALSPVPLSGVFQKGGALLFGATWSLDSGDGIDDKCVFVTTEGEVAVYQGADPSNADDWSIVGRYEIAKPLGKNGFLTIGGDLLIETEDGIVPLSVIVQKSPESLSLSAITRNIEPEWRKEVASRRTLPWEMKKWTARGLAMISLPITGTQEKYCFVVNLQTNAWAKYTNWDVSCLMVYNDQMLFGTSDGKIKRAEVGGSDDGTPYVCKYAGLPDHFNSPGFEKTIHSAKATFKTGNAVRAQVSVSASYQPKFPTAPPSIANFSSDVWDVGLWDVALWDSGTTEMISSRWQSIGVSGSVVIPQLQMTFGITPAPISELVSIDFVFDTGGGMV
jgi:hypothetical protein